MDINRLTEKAQEALRAAQSEATRHGHQQIDVEHLLLALLEQDGGLARSILEKSAVDPDLVKQRVTAELARMPKVSSSTGAGGEVTSRAVLIACSCRLKTKQKASKMNTSLSSTYCWRWSMTSPARRERSLMNWA